MRTQIRFAIILILTIILSAGGILIAAFVTMDPSDGGRGGAVAVALSLVVLFLGRNDSNRVFDILTKEAKEFKATMQILRGTSQNRDESEVLQRNMADLAGATDALVRKSEMDEDILKAQNIFLAWSSAIGTMAWGFGDIGAAQLILVFG